MKKQFLVLLILFSLVGCEKDINENPIIAENINIDIFSDDLIMYEPKDVNIAIDNSAEIESVVVYLNDEIIFNQDNKTNVKFTFNPEIYPTGKADVKIEVTEKGGNMTSKEYSIIIHRKLLDVELNDYFFPLEFQDYYLFASASDGALLAVKAIESTPASFTLTTETNIEKDTPYMLTVASRFENVRQESAGLFSVDGLTRSTFKKFTPKSPRRRDIEKQWVFETSGFSPDLRISGSINPKYSSGFDDIDYTFYLSEYRFFNDLTSTEDFYIRAYDRINNESRHMWLKKDSLNTIDVLNADNLTNQNQVEGEVDVTYTDGFENGHTRNLRIKGYESEADFHSNDYHSIWSSGHSTSQSPNMFIQPTEKYTLDTSFFRYSHFLHLEDYITIRTGIPLEKYDIPDWNLDFDILDKQITVTTSGVGHSTGKILISAGNNVDDLPIIEGKMLLYFWNLNFDSANTSSIRLPELPEELKDWSFGKFYESSTAKIKWARLERYEGINDYENYLNQIIQENKVPLKVSPLFEAKYKSNDEFDFFTYDPDTFFY